jgi:hypothetical protein
VYNVRELTEYFEYLDYLRKSGQTNMFGASSYLMSEYEIPKQEAMDILGVWMDTFDDEIKPEERAKKYLAIEYRNRVM